MLAAVAPIVRNPHNIITTTIIITSAAASANGSRWSEGGRSRIAARIARLPGRSNRPQAPATAVAMGLLREVDESQMYIVNLAKDLAAKGEIVITDSKGEAELVY